MFDLASFCILVKMQWNKETQQQTQSSEASPQGFA